MSIVHSTEEENATRVIVTQPSAQPLDTMSTNEFFKHCFICKKYIGETVDIYVYMGMPFCSKDCRNKEMDKDSEEKTKNPVKVNMRKRSRKDYAPKVIIPDSDA